MEELSSRYSKMHAFSLISLVLVLAIFRLAPAQKAPARAAEPSSSAAATNLIPVYSTNVTVFFESGKIVNLEELAAEARRALAAAGHRLPQGPHCGINLTVGGESPGCSVIIQDLQAKMLYQVVFDSHGRCRVDYAGPAKHGTPKLIISAPQSPGSTNSR